MVMQEGESQEAVGQDVLDLDQQVLDQGMNEAAVEQQYVTREQFDQMMSNHQQVATENQSMRNHLNGLESRIDKQANAFRSQIQEQADAASRKQAQELQSRILDNFDDPDQRVLWQQYFDTQNSVASPAPSYVPNEPAPRPSQQASGNDWADVHNFIRKMNIDPNDKRIDYTVLVNENLSPEDRQERFLANIGAVASSAPVATPAAQAATQAPAQTPQRSAGPVGTGYRNAEDLMDALISGKVDANKYRELAPRYGIPL